MGKDERFDIVIIGAGPNGMTTAAYLAKCGLSVCVLEERTECGGACETQEPIPGVRIYPHAMLMYASPAPGFEQLELHKYGFRMEWDPTNSLEAGNAGMACTEGWRMVSDVDKMGWAKIGGLLGQPPFSPGALARHLLVSAPPARDRGDGREHPLHAGVQEAPARHLDPRAARDDHVRSHGRAPRDRALQDGHGHMRPGRRARRATGRAWRFRRPSACSFS